MELARTVRDCRRQERLLHLENGARKPSCPDKAPAEMPTQWVPHQELRRHCEDSETTAGQAHLYMVKHARLYVARALDNKHAILIGVRHA